MAWTTIEKIHPNQGDGGPDGIYYAGDILMVLNQPGAVGNMAIGVKEINAVVPFHSGDSCKALVAVDGFDVNGNPVLMTSDFHRVALRCPPLNQPGPVGL